MTYELGFLDLASGFMKDDPAGIAALFDTLDSLADAPRPGNSFPYGSGGIRRLRHGRYRVIYTIDESSRTVHIDHVARLP